MAVNSANFKEMSGPPFWAATWSLAAGLRRSSVIQAYSAHLPRNAPSRAHGIGGRLQSMRAANANLAPALRLWAETSMWMSSGLAFIHQDDESLSEPDWEHWTALARLVEQSHHLMVGWVRAQLPGYPQLQVPALARGSVLTTREFSWKHRWFREDFGQGWQFGAPPAEICSLLGMARDEGVAVLEALSTVAIALADTAPWRAFSDAFETCRRRSKAGRSRRLKSERLSGV